MEISIANNKYHIRDAQESDVEHLVEMKMELESYLDTCNPNLWHVSANQIDSLTEKYNRILNVNHCKVLVVVKEETGETVGMATGRVIHHDKFRHKITGKIDDVWIDENHRHNGLCRSLVDILRNYFRENNIKNLTLEYVSGNETAASVWKKMGFEPVIIIANGVIDS